MANSDYDSRPNNLLHEAVEEACDKNPNLVLMPYDQIKQAALILARRLLAQEKVIDAARKFCESTLGEMSEVDGSDSASIPAEFMLLHYAIRELDGKPMTLAPLCEGN